MKMNFTAFKRLTRRCLRAYSSYKHHVGSEPLRCLTYGQALEESSRKYPERIAIISRQQNNKITYSELIEKTDRFAAGLKRLGLKSGDRVGLWAPNMMEWAIVNAACARSGFIVVAINPAYQGPEIKYCINKVGIKTLICPKQIDKNNYLGVLNKIIPNLDNCRPESINCEEIPSLKNIILLKEHDTIRGTLGYDQVMGFGNEHDFFEIKDSQKFIDRFSFLNIQFTSGTTGLPKAAAVSHNSVVNNGYLVGKRSGLDLKQNKICMQVPFFHAFGYSISMTSAFSHGATIVLPAFSYNPLENLKAIHEEQCNIIHGTPTMYVDLVSTQIEHKLDISPDFAVSGGAPCPPQLFRDMKTILNVREVKSVYGLSETTAVVFQSLPEEDDLKATETVGHVGDHVEAKVVDESGNVVPFGKPGELWLRGYMTMRCYWNDENRTKETLTDDGWLKTGDQFVLESNGYGRIVGRLKDMINRGGENVYPKEIEDFIITHPDVVDVHVVGLPHERLGEEICACIKVKEGVTLSQQDIKKFCEGNLANFKIPSRVEIVESYPTTQSGKVQKYKIREQLLENKKVSRNL